MLTKTHSFPVLRTRFAPSPTGHLHLGHALAAQVACEIAREFHGEFLLRHEDIDLSRVKEEYYTSIETDLKWLGLDWQKPVMRQCERTSAYENALMHLRKLDLVYPCFCTRGQIQSELERIGAAPQGHDAPHYPGICRRLPRCEQEQRIKSGQPHAWRLDEQRAGEFCGPLHFHDLKFGHQIVNPTQLGDVILARKDIGIAYHLAVVVDDAEQGITLVTRGEDLLSSTHVHRLLQKILNLPEPRYFHHPLVLDSQGKRLAKRDHSTSLHELRSEGLSVHQVLLKLESELTDCQTLWKAHSVFLTVCN